MPVIMLQTSWVPHPQQFSKSHVINMGRKFWFYGWKPGGAHWVDGNARWIELEMSPPKAMVK